ncbi:MAG: hypothetical protein WBB07_13930 [Mycobacterium sp.]
MSTPTSRAAVLRGTLVGACSVLMTAAAHTAGGGSAHGTALALLLLIGAAIGAVVSAISVERHWVSVAASAGALGLVQVVGHTAMSAAAHHGATPSTLMVGAHLVATVAVAVLLTLVEFLYLVCGSVLCWLRLVIVHRGRPRLPAGGAFASVVVRPVRLCPGLGMRAPPRAVVSGV